MGNALDAFKAQREAVESLHAKLNEVASLVATLKQQVDGLALHPELKQTLHDEQVWLAKAQDLVQQVRHWREREFRNFRYGVVWRWVLACAFALAAVGIGAATYVWTSRPYAAEIERLRTQAQFADQIEHRIS